MRRPQVDTSATSRLPQIKMLFYRIQNCDKYQAKPSMGLIDLDNGLRRLSIMGWIRFILTPFISVIYLSSYFVEEFLNQSLFVLSRSARNFPKKRIN